MNVQCWIVQFIADPFRQEPKNIGVFVDINGRKLPFFLGQSNMGDSVSQFKSKAIEANDGPPVKAYYCWIDYWHECLAENKWEQILATQANNFKIIDNGTIAFQDDVKDSEILAYTYNRFVDKKSQKRKQSKSSNIERRVDRIFKSEHLLEKDLSRGILYPVEKQRKFHVKEIDYAPTYSQEHEKINIYEVFNFNMKKNFTQFLLKGQLASLSLSEMSEQYQKQVYGYALASGIDDLEKKGPKRECYELLKNQMTLLNIEEEDTLEDFIQLCNATAKGNSPEPLFA